MKKLKQNFLCFLVVSTFITSPLMAQCESCNEAVISLQDYISVITSDLATSNSENSECNANYNQSQLELSQVQYQLDFANNQISDLESQLTSLQDQNLSLSFQIDSLLLLLNSIQVEDGFSQEDVINAYELGLSLAYPSQVDIPIDLPLGWSMFGYTCLDSIDAILGFSEISDKIEIVKDEWGLAYLPDWEFNALGGLNFSEGYQIKMLEEVSDFQFCKTISLQAEIPGCTDSTAFNFNELANVDDASCIDILYGCLDNSYAEFNELANTDDGSCQNIIGCTDPIAENYSPEATQDNGLCIVPNACIDPMSCNYSDNADFISIEKQLEDCDYSCLNCSSETACNFDENAGITPSLYDNICQSYAEWYGEDFDCTDEMVLDQLQYSQPYQTFEQAIFTYAQNNYEGDAVFMIYDELMSINIYDSISFVQCVEPNSLFDNDCDCSLDFSSFSTGWFNCNNTSIYDDGGGAYSSATLNFGSEYENGILDFSGVGKVFNVYVSEEMSTFTVDGSGVDHVVNVYYSSNTNVINSMSGVNNVVNFIEQ
jgi:hypothetical protein